jgi:hypothetical protein
VVVLLESNIGEWRIPGLIVRLAGHFRSV